MDSQKIYGQVQDYYGSLAKSSGLENSHAIAKAFGYSEDELKTTPMEANLGVSCGNPLAIASLREVSHYFDSKVSVLNCHREKQW